MLGSLLLTALAPPRPDPTSSRLVKEVKRLEAEVASTECSISQGPYTVQSLQAEREATLRLLEKRACDRRRGRVLQRGEHSRGGEAKVEEAVPGGGPGSDGGDADVDAGDVRKHGGDGSNRAEETHAAAEAVEVGKEASSAPGGANGDASGRGGGPVGEGEHKGAPSVCGREEVEGPFDPEPELRSRMADRSCSLKFVTAEEDARMRREELAKAIGARGGVDQAPPPEEAPQSMASARGRGGEPEGGEKASEGGDVARSNGHGGDAAPAAGAGGTDEKGKGDSSRGGGSPRVRDDAGGARGVSRIKAFGAILEETLSRRLVQRPGQEASSDVAEKSPRSPRSTTAAGSSRRRLSPSSRTRRPAARGGAEATAKGPAGSAGLPAEKSPKPRSLTPPCRPKSKFFRSMAKPLSPTAANPSGGGAQQPPAGAGTGRPMPPPPPPPPMAGLLSQIRERSGGLGGGAKGGAGNPKALMGNLLAEIRARSGKHGGGKGDPEGADDGRAVERGVAEGRGAAAGAAQGFPALARGASVPGGGDPGVPMTPPPPPLQPRSLFSSPPKPRASPGLAPDFLAEVRAKGAAREALRRAAAVSED